MVDVEKLNPNDFEQVVYCNDPKVGLKSIIALHDTTLGPGTGGCRFYPYETEEEALTDVLRLSKGMTYKSAISRLKFGGGKAVIIGDPKKIKTPELLKRFAEFVNSLHGQYITAKDVGVNGADLRVMSEVTPHILGIEGKKGSSGDPSIATAYGIYRGIQAICQEIFQKDSLRGMTFAVQGAGSVAYYLLKHFDQEGVNIVLCDVNPSSIQKCQTVAPNLKIVDPNEIYDVECDIFSPCAMGGILNQETLSRLKCKVVAGAANNQLATLKDGYDLHEKGIFYAPDYVINAGGIINIAYEQNGYDQKGAFEHVEGIYDTMVQIIRRSKSENIPPFLIADLIAEEILKEAKKKVVKSGVRPQRGLRPVGLTPNPNFSSIL
ncbi:MAG: hypothetical protein A3B70_07740 [Deltaproteobacteria bacterium RIFCSPHIGHO2_02_FULL_40_11]|nr:MAG: hypothetical protein A3B70_07740 [Deltaproteobacteria bacterium RIFCSPHIGHO2_02_FULL_40_11]